MLNAARRLDDEDLDAFPLAPPLPPPAGSAKGRRKSPLTDLANELAREMMERHAAMKAAGEWPPRSPPRPPRVTPQTRFFLAQEARKAEQDARKAEEREYRRLWRARDRAVKRGDPNPPAAPVSPTVKRKRAEEVARAQERQRWLAWIEECRASTVE